MLYVFISIWHIPLSYYCELWSFLLSYWCTYTGPRTARMSGRERNSLITNVSFLAPLSPHMLWVSDCRSSQSYLIPPPHHLPYLDPIDLSLHTHLRHVGIMVDTHTQSLLYLSVCDTPNVLTHSWMSCNDHDRLGSQLWYKYASYVIPMVFCSHLSSSINYNDMVVSKCLLTH